MHLSLYKSLKPSQFYSFIQKPFTMKKISQSASRTNYSESSPQQARPQRNARRALVSDVFDARILIGPRVPRDNKSARVSVCRTMAGLWPIVPEPEVRCRADDSAWKSSRAEPPSSLDPCTSRLVAGASRMAGQLCCPMTQKGEGGRGPRWNRGRHVAVYRTLGDSEPKQCPRPLFPDCRPADQKSRARSRLTSMEAKRGNSASE